jgi:hypothetical protein
MINAYFHEAFTKLRFPQGDVSPEVRSSYEVLKLVFLLLYSLLLTNWWLEDCITNTDSISCKCVPLDSLNTENVPLYEEILK